MKHPRLKPPTSVEKHRAIRNQRARQRLRTRRHYRLEKAQHRRRLRKLKSLPSLITRLGIS